jgi:tripartite-type tricarboxylate transporter receptor subunit TctC
MTRIKLSRRDFLASTAALTSLGSRAQVTNPSQPVRMIVPFAAGGATDALARDMAKGMGAAMRQTIVIENIGGGAGVPALTRVAGAPPDGATLLFAASGNITAQPLLDKNRVDILAKVTPVGMIATAPHVLVVTSQLPFKTMADLIAYAKAHPGELNFGSAGVGGLAHLGTELLARTAHINIQHVPYRGASQGLNDLVSGVIHAMFGTMPSFTSMVQTGTVRAIGLTAPSGASPLHGIPLIAKTLPGYGYKSWNGIFAPAGTPAPVIAQIYGAMKQAAADKDLAKRFDEQGVDIALADSAELADIMRRERAVWEKVIRDANIQRN